MVVVDDQSAQALVVVLVVGLALVEAQSAQVLDEAALAEVVAFTTTQTWLEVVIAAQASTGATQVFQSAAAGVVAGLGAALVDQVAHEVTASGFLLVVGAGAQVFQLTSSGFLLVVVVFEETEFQSAQTLVVGSGFLVVVEAQSAQVLVVVGLTEVEEEAHGSQAESAVTAGVAMATPARAAAATNDFILSLGGFVWSRKSDCGQVLFSKE